MTATINGNAGGVWVGEEGYELCERRGVVFRAFPETEGARPMSAFDHYEAKDGDAMTDGLWTVRLTPNGRCHAVGGDSGDYQIETKTRCGRDYCSNRVEAHYYETEDQWRNESRMCHTCGDILAGVNGFSAELEVAP